MSAKTTLIYNMTSSTTNPPSNIAGRELNLIASSFVKQYYTLLNKAPCYIHNFYSQSSTFIHGTVEVANEHFTEPIVGREKIQSKMEEMKLNDCRAKIKQIDCLETLAGGLVIQVIGELSNNGRPMRPFMQTFVLAPSPDEARQDGKDPSHQRGPGANDPRRGAHVNENNSSPSNNQKFFVLNSIFRYQDDGLDSESEDDVVGIQANTSIERSNNAGEHLKEARKLTHVTGNAAQPSPPVNSAATAHVKNQQTPIMNETESRRTDVVSGGGGSRIVPNGTGSNDKKTETSEKSTENGKPTLEQSSQQSTTSSSSAQGVQPPASISSSAATSQSKPINTTATTTTTSTPTNATAAPRPQPSSEPKTWANMVSRNAHPPPASVPSTASATKTLHPDQQHQNQPSHQLQQSQQQQQQSHHQHQTQSDQQQNTQSNNNPNNSNNNNNNNNRRRHMIRKPSNKSNGGGSGGGGGGGGSGTGGGGRGDGRGEGRIDGRGDGRGDGGPRLKNNRDRPRPPPAGKPMA